MKFLWTPFFIGHPWWLLLTVSWTFFSYSSKILFAGRNHQQMLLTIFSLTMVLEVFEWVPMASLCPFDIPLEHYGIPIGRASLYSWQLFIGHILTRHWYFYQCILIGVWIFFILVMRPYPNSYINPWGTSAARHCSLLICFAFISFPHNCFTSSAVCP